MEDILTLNGDSVFSFAGGETSLDCAIPAWHLWEKLASSGASSYSSAMQDVATVKSVREFWAHWINVPQPSELLEGNKIVREEVEGKPANIDSLMLFREGVKPEWEDPANRSGGHFAFTFRPATVSPAQVDEYWNNIVLGLVGGSIEPKDMVTGVRLVDKMSSGRNSCIRIEVWFTNYADTEAVNTLRSNVEACMSLHLDDTHGHVPKAEQKCHYE